MLRLREYERRTLELQDADRDHLLPLLRGGGKRAIAVFQSITPTSRDRCYDVTPGPYVGRIGLPSGEAIDIDSRFPFEDVVRLIAYSGRLPNILEKRRSEMQGGGLLLDLIASAFTREVDRVIGTGLAKGYVTRRFVEPPYPGALDVRYHLNRLTARPDRLATSARRLTVDIEPNQALASALSVLVRARLETPTASVAVARQARVFRGISDVPLSPGQIGRLHLSALHSHYKDVLPLAALILAGSSVIPRGQGLAGASILFHMPKVWENCVERWARERWGPDYRVETQHYFDLSAGGEMTSAADVVVWHGRDLVALYDAKYKAPGTAPAVADVYQLVTYCDRLGLPEATLVYPGDVENREFRVGTRVVHMMGLRQREGAGETELVATSDA